MAHRRRAAALFLVLIGLSLAALLQYEFEFMRYYFEYYFEIVRWHALTRPTCEYTTSTPPLALGESTPSVNHSWHSLLSEQLAYTRDRWVLSRPPVGLGLCNRILHSLSALLFAMATNRTLWLEWEPQPYQYITANEYAGMSGYDALFRSDLHHPRFRPPTQIIERAVEVKYDACFAGAMRFSTDLNKDYSARVLRIEGGEWWAPLLFKNRAVKRFAGLDLMDGFRRLFRAMFTLRPPRFKVETECTWLIQYRTIWPPPRRTAPIEAFLACAHAGGLTPAEYRTTWIVADDPAALMAHATPEAARVLSAMHLPQAASCRGPCGDRQAMETMYRLSRCKHAVLTLGSSFGTCIASLAGIDRQFRVSEFGECLRVPTADGPLNANTYSRHGNLGTYLAQP